jgi:small-conductance mechanosensitive channel
MTTTTISVIIVIGLLLAAAAFLRWHTVPVRIASWARRRTGRILTARRAHPAGRELDAAPTVTTPRG